MYELIHNFGLIEQIMVLHKISIEEIFSIFIISIISIVEYVYRSDR